MIRNRKKVSDTFSVQMRVTGLHGGKSVRHFFASGAQL
jgi:hypothetical protein